MLTENIPPLWSRDWRQQRTDRRQRSWRIEGRRQIQRYGEGETETKTDIKIETEIKDEDRVG